MMRKNSPQHNSGIINRPVPLVLGKVVDEHTRCLHYHGDTDIVAIKFKCCNDYFPCFQCHAETTGHVSIRWNMADIDLAAILCGNCYESISIQNYITATSCPNCSAQFNPRCKLHHHLYFDFETAE